MSGKVTVTNIQRATAAWGADSRADWHDAGPDAPDRHDL